MVRIAGRFGLSVEEADAAIRGESATIPITARCSVFAKSEMPHFGNQGRPADALFRGYFGSIARYVAAMLARARVDGPVYAVGGCARIRTLVDALSEAVGADVRVPESFLFLEAIGAALLAAEQCHGEPLGRLPEDPATLFSRTSPRFTVLRPASEWQERVRCLEAPPVQSAAERAPSVLGLDLGSTGSKAVLTSLDSGEIVLDLYDRTQGNPVDAVQRLVRAVLERTTPDIRAIALTGSGREAAATVVRAAFPELADRIVTLNEIVAHATAAIRCDEHGGESMSVVEIGGQDAKFIQIEGGRIVESDMNKACSAGTGSFLEEQSLFYGETDIGEFTRLAMTATRPPDLGQMCTVFVSDAAAEAHNEGFSVPDLFAGFQYSVIHNYINRVMGQRTFGQRIFFQGKPASGVSLAWTLAAVTGREVVVPPNPVRWAPGASDCVRSTNSVRGARGGARVRAGPCSGRRGRGQERVPVPCQPLRHALHYRAYARLRERWSTAGALRWRVPQIRGGIERASQAAEGGAVGLRRATGAAGAVSRGTAGQPRDRHTDGRLVLRSDPLAGRTGLGTRLRRARAAPDGSRSRVAKNAVTRTTRAPVKAAHGILVPTSRLCSS